MDEADAEVRRAREKGLKEQYSANEDKIRDIDKEIQKHEQRRKEYYDEADKIETEAKPNFREKAANKERQAQNETRLRDEWQDKRKVPNGENEQIVKQIQAGRTGPRPSQAHGGAYRDVPTAGGQVNHIPPLSVLPEKISKYDGPSIWMETADHMKTNSWGTGAIIPTAKYPYKTAEQWRAAQRELITKGKFREAMQMDIDDIRAKFGNKYERGIKEMSEHVDKLNP